MSIVRIERPLADARGSVGRALRTIGAIAVLAAGAGAMPVVQQNELVQTYCAVCHTDAARNGGLSLEHFDAARPDPGVAEMLLWKLKTGAIGAAGVKPPDDPTIQAWIAATAEEADGAERWSVARTEDPLTKASILAASIVRESPSAVSKDVPDAYRLTVTCRADTRQGGMELAWSPAVPMSGQVLSAVVDQKGLSSYTVTGTEKMGNGGTGSSGPGSVVLSKIGLPVQTLTIRDAFPHETVEFPFRELGQEVRQGLLVCFGGLD